MQNKTSQHLHHCKSLFKSNLKEWSELSNWHCNRNPSCSILLLILYTVRMILRTWKTQGLQIEFHCLEQRPQTKQDYPIHIHDGIAKMPEIKRLYMLSEVKSKRGMLNRTTLYMLVNCFPVWLTLIKPGQKTKSFVPFIFNFSL